MLIGKQPWKPIHLAADGSYFVHDNDSVLGPNGTRVTMAKCYRGYILAQYIDGDDQEHQRTVCVDEYMTNALERNALYEANCAAKQALKSQARATSSATPEVTQNLTLTLTLTLTLSLTLTSLKDLPSSMALPAKPRLQPHRR